MANADVDIICDKEIDEANKAMRKVRKKIIDEDGVITWEFCGGVSRAQDIDVL